MSRSNSWFALPKGQPLKSAVTPFIPLIVPSFFLTFLPLTSLLCSYHSGKWFEPRGISYLFGMIIWVRVVFRKTVTDVSTTWAVVIFRVKWRVVIGWWHLYQDQRHKYHHPTMTLHLTLKMTTAQLSHQQQSFWRLPSSGRSHQTNNSSHLLNVEIHCWTCSSV